MADCIGTGCKADSLLRRVETAERDRDTRAGWLAQWLIDKHGGTNDLPAWVAQSARYYREALDRAETAEREREALQEALRELVAIRDLEKAAAKTFGLLNKPGSSDADYHEYDRLSTEIARRKPLAWDAARAADVRRAKWEPVIKAAVTWHHSRLRVTDSGEEWAADDLSNAIRAALAENRG